MSDRLLIVSVDSHAQMPPEAWPKYLEARYHDELPGLREENEIYTGLMGTLSTRVQGPATFPVFDADRAVQDGGFYGIWDADVRLREMDREGIAGEFVYFGDHRAVAMFFNIFNRPHSRELCDAGMRAHHRWLADTFGHATDRLFLVGVGTTGTDIDATVAELDWIADHGFAGTYAPGFTAQPQLPPLWDDYWEPVWQRCVERGLPLFVHAGHGLPQGVVLPDVERIKAEVAQAGGSEADFIGRVAGEVLTGEFFSDVRPRQPMWQLMLGGVFDRHPDLKLVMTEVRSDWLPATLGHLDAVYLAHRDDLPAKRMPTEYWHSNCITSLSFVHKAEVDMRHEMGITTLAFGRDYPHNESTWPNTTAWLRDAFAGVPENELRLILGENVIRTLGLDRAKLADVASRIGPRLEEIATEVSDVDEALLAHFDLRGGYRKPAEGGAKLGLIEPMLRADLAKAGITT
jgi:predicted TIM-barrel fold metal-dependent hydrolase